MKDVDEIDELFRKNFDQFEVVPDASVKAAIDKQLFTPKRKFGFLFWFLPLLIGVGASMYLFTGELVTTKLNEKEANASRMLAENQSDQALAEEQEAKASSNLKNSKKISANLKNKEQVTAETATSRSSSDAKSSVNKTNKRSSALKTDLENRRKSKKGTLNVKSKKTIEGGYNKNGIKRKNSKTDESFIGDIREGENEQKKPASVKGDTDTQPKDDIAGPNDVADTKEPEEEKIKPFLPPDELIADRFADTSKNQPITVVRPEIVKSSETKSTGISWTIRILAGLDRLSYKDRNIDVPSSLEIIPDSTTPPVEYIQLKANSYYGKIELGIGLNDYFDIIVGAGYRSTTIRQKLTTFVSENAPIPSVIDTTLITSFNQFVMKRYSRTQDFKVQSVLVPVGLSYQVNLGKRTQFHLDLMSEMSFGSNAPYSKDTLPSNMNFNKFAFQVGVRPEFHYGLKKSSIFVFGSVNKSLRSHLNWEGTNSNPWLFGGGIGWRFKL